MSLSLSPKLLAQTTSKGLAPWRKSAAQGRSDRNEVIELLDLTDADLQDIHQAALSVKDNRTARAVDAIVRARQGDFSKPVPNIKAFAPMLRAFLAHDVVDGWLFVEAKDGQCYPELITAVRYVEEYPRNRQEPEVSVIIDTLCYGLTHNERKNTRTLGMDHNQHRFSPQQVANRRLPDILAASHLFKETPARKATYLQEQARHAEVTDGRAFAQQFRFTGIPYRLEAADAYWRSTETLTARRVIHDLPEEDLGTYVPDAESELFEHDDGPGVGAVPRHALVRTFDLRTHEWMWVHANSLTPYIYNKSLRHKLVLPESHRDLLDVLTTDLEAFVEDIIEGKSAGNIVLCKGIPGVGKTLTAEVYAELIEKPLYSIHAGNLGTDAETIQERLAAIFKLSQRWGCVLLLDEADVFVVQRGDNIVQNAIVAEFLRVLEYFSGLLFMTTNRPFDIDDAIISRCAAIIHYGRPSSSEAAAVWQVMATQFQTPMADTLVADLVQQFPTIAHRDIKMLFRLALRVSRSRQMPLSLDIFRQCAMFRAIPAHDAAPPESRA
jgi:hypothetical protein